MSGSKYCVEFFTPSSFVQNDLEYPIVCKTGTLLIHYDHSNVSRVFETLLMYVLICYLVGSPISDIIAT